MSIPLCCLLRKHFAETAGGTAEVCLTPINQHYWHRRIQCVNKEDAYGSQAKFLLYTTDWQQSDAEVSFDQTFLGRQTIDTDHRIWIQSMPQELLNEEAGEWFA